MTVSGNIAVLQSGDDHNSDFGIGLTDAKGRNVLNNGEVVLTLDSKGKPFFFFLKTPLDDGMTLHVRVLVGSQTEAVPFELRDVPLPSVAQMKLDDALIETAAGERTPNHNAPSLAPKIKDLLARGADANARDNDGYSALYYRAKHGDEASVRLLLEHGANPNLVGYDTGESPLFDAIDENQPQTALLLISHGANVHTADNDAGPLLLRAMFNHSLPLLRVLIEKGARVDTQDNNGVAPLMCATVDKWYPGMKALLDARANPNLRADDKFDISTPLIQAASEGDAKATSLLLAHRANPNLVNHKGETALILLAQSHSSNFDASHQNLARMLLAHGANVNARSKNGNTALKWARANGNAALVRLLQGAGAKS